MKKEHNAADCQICSRWDDNAVTLGLLIKHHAIDVVAQIIVYNELCFGEDAKHISETILSSALEKMRVKLQRLKARQAKLEKNSVSPVVAHAANPKTNV